MDLVAISRLQTHKSSPPSPTTSDDPGYPSSGTDGSGNLLNSNNINNGCAACTTAAPQQKAEILRTSQSKFSMRMEQLILVQQQQQQQHRPCIGVSAPKMHATSATVKAQDVHSSSSRGLSVGPTTATAAGFVAGASGGGTFYQRRGRFLIWPVETAASAAAATATATPATARSTHHVRKSS